MKTQLLALGLVALLCPFAFSQSPAESELYKKLTNKVDSAKALETVLEKPDEYSALLLYSSAKAAFAEKRLEDSGFLFYCAQLRARFDKECFPPKGIGGDSPFVALSAISFELGSVINPAVMAEPKAFAKAIERVRAWEPKASATYDPGYQFTDRKTEQAARDAAKPNRTVFLEYMTNMAVLLNDAEYFAAFRIVQGFNLGTLKPRPTQEEFNKAMESMKRIEKEKKVKEIQSK